MCWGAKRKRTSPEGGRRHLGWLWGPRYGGRKEGGALGAEFRCLSQRRGWGWGGWGRDGGMVRGSGLCEVGGWI